MSSNELKVTHKLVLTRRGSTEKFSIELTTNAPTKEEISSFEPNELIEEYRDFLSVKTYFEDIVRSRGPYIPRIGDRIGLNLELESGGDRYEVNLIVYGYEGILYHIDELPLGSRYVSDKFVHAVGDNQSSNYLLFSRKTDNSSEIISLPSGWNWHKMLQAMVQEDMNVSGGYPDPIEGIERELVPKEKKNIFDTLETGSFSDMHVKITEEFTYSPYLSINSSFSFIYFSYEKINRQ